MEEGLRNRGHVSVVQSAAATAPAAAVEGGGSPKTKTYYADFAPSPKIPFNLSLSIVLLPAFLVVVAVGGKQ